MPTLSLLLMQGIPGGGKSYFAKKLAAPLDALIVTADSYPGLYADGKFHPDLLPHAHGMCLRRVCRAIRAGRSVVLDNTNLVAAEITPYVLVGVEFGYQVELVRVPCAQKVAFGRQSHGVPEDKHKKMFDQFKGFRVPSYWPSIKVRTMR